MKIQLNTDRNIKGNLKLEAYVTEVLEHKLKRFSDKITRIEVHLSDQNGDKPGKDDNQCRIEARLRGMKPLMVLERAEHMESAITGAANKIKSVLDTHLEKLRN